MASRGAYEAASGAPVAWSLVDLVALVLEPCDDGLPVLHDHRGMAFGRRDGVVFPLVVDLSAMSLDPRGALAESARRLDLLESDDAPERLRGRPVLATELECHVLEHA
jgi:hypothetical protein